MIWELLYEAQVVLVQQAEGSNLPIDVWPGDCSLVRMNISV
jgi:hypothetical protein